ncbi:MAG TPA: hypothetical protein IGQ16_10275, partial [Thermosynechococcus sp. M3746_W2019_013]|uniref:hypothetical protein n=1 Tax=Thermosynechococcus sp. M3746_W2019_013 TaxID=2747806 RepID=UPI0019DD2EB1
SPFERHAQQQRIHNLLPISLQEVLLLIITMTQPLATDFIGRFNALMTSLRQNCSKMLSKTKIEKYAPYVVWVFFAYFCRYYAIEILNGGNNWKTGDWLINYSAGIVRRGLIGTFLLKVSDFGLPLLWVTYVTQVAIYALIFGLVLKLYYRKKRSLFWLLILFSPAFLLFPFYDTQGGFRKEIIVFLIFAFFCLIYANKNVTPFKLTFISLAYSLGALSHELTVFTLPFFFYLIYVSTKDGLITNRTAIAYSSILATASSVILIFAFFYKGNEALAQAICQSLTTRNLDPNICKGSIDWLSEDTGTALRRVLSLLDYRSLFTPVFLWLALLPLSFTTWWNKEREILFVASIATIFPLFLLAIDWGRWVHVIIFMFFCLALASEVNIKYRYRRIFIVAGLIYLTTWSIPHCCVGGYDTGFLSFLKRALKWLMENLG